MYEVQGLCVDVKYLILGSYENNVYIISDGKGTMVVDPSCQPKKILQALDGAKLDAIVITHAHWDHVEAAAELRAATGRRSLPRRSMPPISSIRARWGHPASPPLARSIAP